MLSVEGVCTLGVKKVEGICEFVPLKCNMLSVEGVLWIFLTKGNILSVEDYYIFLQLKCNILSRKGVLWIFTTKVQNIANWRSFIKCQILPIK